MDISNHDNLSLDTAELIKPQMSEKEFTKILKDHADNDSTIQEPPEEPAEEKMEEEKEKVAEEATKVGDQARRIDSHLNRVILQWVESIYQVLHVPILLPLVTQF